MVLNAERKASIWSNIWKIRTRSISEALRFFSPVSAGHVSGDAGMSVTWEDCEFDDQELASFGAPQKKN